MIVVQEFATSIAHGDGSPPAEWGVAKPPPWPNRGGIGFWVALAAPRSAECGWPSHPLSQMVGADRPQMVHGVASATPPTFFFFFIFF
jgi:hypothetical protein